MSFVRPSFARVCFVRLSFVRLSFVRLSFVRWSFVRLSSVRLSFVRLSFVRLSVGRERRKEHFEALEQAANHAFCEVSSTSKHWNTPRITYFTRFRALRSIETRRESRILRGFEHFEALEQAANHAFYEVSSTSKH